MCVGGHPAPEDGEASRGLHFLLVHPAPKANSACGCRTETRLLTVRALADTVAVVSKMQHGVQGEGLSEDEPAKRMWEESTRDPKKDAARLHRAGQGAGTAGTFDREDPRLRA